MRSPPRQRRNSIGQEDNLNEQGEDDTTQQHLTPEQFEAFFLHEVEIRMKPYADNVTVYLVGDLQAIEDFEPCRGDLIISRPVGRHIGLPNSVGYIASCLENGLSSYEFNQTDLVLRIGSFEMVHKGLN